MNFTERAKAELTERSAEDKKAYLSGFLRAAGSLVLSGGKIGFEFSTENEGAAKCAKRLFFSAFSVELGEGKEESDALNKKQRFTFLYAGERAAHILRELGILAQGGVELGVPAELLRSDGAKKSFLRGVFVGAGSLTVPKRKEEGESSTGYHLGFALSNEDFARGVEQMLCAMGLHAKTAARRGKSEPYIKSAEEIKDFLAAIGAPKAALALTDIMIEREVMSDANRRMNCDLANVSKQVDAAEKSIAAIWKLKESGRLDKLKPSLRETALAREEYAEESLQDLAERLGITKSCLNHRLRKLAELAKEN